MALKLKSIKVVSLKYHIYEGDKEIGTEYNASPEDAMTLAANGYVKLVDKVAVKAEKEEVK